MKHYYPAVFETAEEGGYTVTVPDIEGCEEKDYPTARSVNDIDVSAFGDAFVSLVEFDRQIYERRCRDISIVREQLVALA